jgi:hypothetical protein
MLSALMWMLSGLAPGSGDGFCVEDAEDAEVADDACVLWPTMLLSSAAGTAGMLGVVLLCGRRRACGPAQIG